ncbi:Aspartate aminotransferase, cytoplasmic [Zancudomyces culisetae]|uniref:aspartate transaminase n=1 Tax=Zancudomyces culisetae TaxID=1213189 RepID=A0A1R1PF75_ZANCU|nr:Aspartate aminotransferase, cytoplasmic [Zancudomyces culisetae]OMH81443.1 Aspartate aminotransferase, cytoplasmic [Zancudomyces culisetae]|eukprot:OMH79568.1 Aspartate aminotransferase, cytoplasmic [Zancudomyces culisetae]
MYNADTSSQKVDLGIGAYRDSQGKPWVLPVVEKAEKILLEQRGRNHEYNPVMGDAGLLKGAARIMFGEGSKVLEENRVCSIQTVSGTGGLSVAAAFLKTVYPGVKKAYASNPTWGNHKNIMETFGMEYGQYSYWNKATKGLDYEGMIRDIHSMEDRSIVILHACAHNPTGVDPTRQQWDGIAQAIKAKGHFVIFDTAYQGFATGNLDDDAWAIRRFIEAYDMEMIVTQSFAKNMGLYGERCGVLHVVSANAQVSQTIVSSNLAKSSRSIISSAPRYCGAIASIVLNTPELFAEWKQDCLNLEMSARIHKMRKLLLHNLVKLGAKEEEWSHITSQIGMFSFTGLNEQQVDILIKKYHIYLTSNGRISVAGLNEGNVEYVAKAIYEVSTSTTIQKSNI